MRGPCRELRQIRQATVPAGQSASRQASVIQIPLVDGSPRHLLQLANSFDFDTISGVPGLGFDFPHLAAISGACATTLLRTSGTMAIADRVPSCRFCLADIPTTTMTCGYDQPDQQTVQQIAASATNHRDSAAGSSRSKRSDSANDAGNLSASAPEPQAAVPVPDVGDFILVRRGRAHSVRVRVLGCRHAIAVRHAGRDSPTIAMSDLDADATQQMNEARGTTVQIHN